MRWRALIAVVLGGCVVSEADVQRDFDDHVAASSACDADADCTVISPGCPLGCFVAVRADRADACMAEARDLISAWEGGTRSCDYDCLAAGPVRCESGTCRVDPIP